MKKYLLFVFLLLFLPISVFARQETKENLFRAIEDIHDVQVDDDVMILQTKVNDSVIQFELEEEGVHVTREVHYTFEENHLSFSSGYLIINNENGNYQLSNIVDNQYAFYLYSILESLSTAPYEEESYYNNSQIMNKINHLSAEDKKLFWTDSSNHLEYYNTGKTFGLQLIGKKISDTQMKAVINYQYFLDGDDTILVNPIVEAGQNELLKNPETGNYSFFVTTLLLIVIGLAAYTYCNPGAKEE